MKQVNNRQKMFVKPRQSVQKYMLETSRVSREAGSRTTGQKTDGRKQLGVKAIRRRKSKK
jgi:hypothetical protein